MMRIIWESLGEKGDLITKKKTFLAIFTVLCMIIGLIVWVIVGRILVPGVLGALTFMIYPGFFIGIVMGCIYIYNK